MLFVERSNRTEQLLEGLADRLVAGGRDPLAPSMIIVQGPGMERWLAQSIAERSGICANTEFKFPREFLELVFATREADLRNPQWSPRALLWSVARKLRSLRGEEDFAPLTRHLEAVDGDWRSIQLADQIATLFDQYITYRPEWIRDWQRAKGLPSDRDERWQARLVRELGEELGPGHFADRAVDFLEAARGKERDAMIEGLSRAFPAGIEVFAVSTLPPLFISVLGGLAELRDVHLSVLAPARGFFADLWLDVREADLAPPPEASQAELPGLFDVAPATPAMRLLTGLGRLGGDFQRCLTELENVVEVGRAADGESFVSPLGSPAEKTAPSLLARLQADLLDVYESPESDRVVRADDESIRVHLCHGSRRELEVVAATLRAAFEADSTLLPEEVIVMAPQIDEIAPEIEAVFGATSGNDLSIPFRIADRGAMRRSPVADAFTTFLDLLTGRATRSELIDWLSREPARARFGLDEDAVERSAEWAANAGVRFGLDADHRADLDLEGEPAHTWSDGLSRLALAHAVGATGEVYAGSAPVPLDPFADPSILGALGDLTDLMARARLEAKTPRPVGAWRAWLGDLLGQVCERNDANAHEHAAIRGWLHDLAEEAKGAGFDEALPFEAIRERLLLALSSSPAPQAFLSGGVTFCELVPLRAIPFRIVVILGMSDGAFPRGRPAPGFDLMARAPRAGDRNTRVDDRYLFLEAILSARDRLILTVPGRDVRDGSHLPPSIVVTELLDSIENAFASPDGEPLREQIEVSHPLQPHNTRYFEVPGDSRLLGRDEEAYAGAQARLAARVEGEGRTRRFLERIPRRDAPPVGDVDPSTLSLDELSARILQPTRFFTRERLHLRMPRTEEGVGDLDPIELGGLERFQLSSALFDDLIAGTDPERAFARLRAGATTPSGLSGELTLRALASEVTEMVRLSRGRLGEVDIPDHEAVIELDVVGVGACRLVGRLDRLTNAGRLSVRLSKIGGRAEFDAWIRHLFLCVCVEEGLDVAPQSVFIGRGEKSSKSRDRIVVFESVDNAREELAKLFAWAKDAMDAPLPFFPEASRAFAARAGTNVETAWREAQNVFLGGDSFGNVKPEGERDLEMRRLWEGASPIARHPDPDLDHRFEELALSFFAPLDEARTVVSR